MPHPRAALWTLCVQLWIPTVSTAACAFGTCDILTDGTMSVDDFAPINELLRHVVLRLPDVMQSIHGLDISLSNLECRNLRLFNLEVSTHGDPSLGFDADGGAHPPGSIIPMPPPPPPSPPPPPPQPPPPGPCVAAPSCNSGCGVTPAGYMYALSLPWAQADQCYYCTTYSWSNAPGWCEWREDGFFKDKCCVRHQCSGGCFYYGSGRRLASEGESEGAPESAPEADASEVDAEATRPMRVEGTSAVPALADSKGASREEGMSREGEDEGGAKEESPPRRLGEAPSEHFVDIGEELTGTCPLSRRRVEGLPGCDCTAACVGACTPALTASSLAGRRRRRGGHLRRVVGVPRPRVWRLGHHRCRGLGRIPAFVHPIHLARLGHLGPDGVLPSGLRGQRPSQHRAVRDGGQLAGLDRHVLWPVS